MSIFASLSNCGLETFIGAETVPFRNGLFANGLWQKRKTDVGIFTLQVEKIDGTKYGLTQQCEPSFESTLPKLPGTIFLNILEHYREIYKTMKSEVYTVVFWNKEKQDYEIFIPKQIVSGAQVNFENDPAKLNDSNLIAVLDLHSHNVMGKCYSLLTKIFNI